MRKLIFCLLQLVVIHGALAASTLQVGGKPVVIAEPAGYVALPPDAPFSKTMASLTPAANQLRAVLISTQTMQNIERGVDPQLKRYFVLHSNRQLESTNLTPTQFAELRDLLRSRHVKLLEQASKSTQAGIDLGVKAIDTGRNDPTAFLKVGEVRDLGIFVDNESAFGLTSVARYKGQLAGAKQDFRVLIAMTTALVNQRLLYFFVYSDSTTPEEMEWIKKASIDWIAASQRANPPLTAPDELPSSP